MALGDPIPQLKHQLCDAILAVIGDWDQCVIGRVLGIDQPAVSQLQHRRLSRFSLQKLIRMLARMDRRVDVTVTNVGRSRLPRLFNFPPRAGRFARVDTDQVGGAGPV